jgi:hypothetical protein
MFRLLASLFKRKVKECDHIYYPSWGEHSTTPIGQECILCQKFNSLEDLQIIWKQDAIKFLDTL